MDNNIQLHPSLQAQLDDWSVLAPYLNDERYYAPFRHLGSKYNGEYLASDEDLDAMIARLEAVDIGAEAEAAARALEDFPLWQSGQCVHALASGDAIRLAVGEGVRRPQGFDEARAVAAEALRNGLEAAIAAIREEQRIRRGPGRFPLFLEIGGL